MPQTLLVHEMTTLGGAGHFNPQAPQLTISLVIGVSQPLLGMASQFPHPGSHLPIPHTELAQAAVACGVLPQLLPQLPQLAESMAALISQPSWSCALQSLYPCVHAPR